jgi:hypothetical protein
LDFIGRYSARNVLPTYKTYSLSWPRLVSTELDSLWNLSVSALITIYTALSTQNFNAVIYKLEYRGIATGQNLGIVSWNNGIPSKTKELKLIERQVKCVACGHQWASKVDSPRCSKCGSRYVEEVMDIPTVENVGSEPTLPPSPGEVDHSKIFTAFDEGKSLIDLVKRGLCNPDEALESWNEYEELKKKTLEITGEPILEERVDDLEGRLATAEKELEGILNVTNRGSWVKENCKHYREGYCRRVYWEEEPKVAFILRSGEENGKWYIDPSAIYCALCTGNTISTLELDVLVNMMAEDLFNLKDNKYPHCGQLGVVLLAQCRFCGATVHKILK